MLKNSNLSSRSTFYSSKTFKNSKTKNKKKTKKKIPERIPLTSTQILANNMIKDIIEHAIQIADFHLTHKKNQKTYENRRVKREKIFINKDELFMGCLPHTDETNYEWTFISKLIGKIIYIESNNNSLMIYNFNTESENPLIFNLCENDKKIISAELLENEVSNKSYLLLLFHDFSFITYDLFLMNQEGNKLYSEEERQMLVYKSQITEFNFKPYLNIPNINEYIPDYQNNIKIIIFPKSLNNFCTDIIVNFTQIAGKFLIFNILSNTIIGNYIINQKDYVTKESEYLSNLRILINAFFRKVCYIKQYECLIQIIS